MLGDEEVTMETMPNMNCQPASLRLARKVSSPSTLQHQLRFTNNTWRVFGEMMLEMWCLLPYLPSSGPCLVGLGRVEPTFQAKSHKTGITSYPTLRLDLGSHCVPLRLDRITSRRRYTWRYRPCGSTYGPHVHSNSSSKQRSWCRSEVSISS